MLLYFLYMDELFSNDSLGHIGIIGNFILILNFTIVVGNKASWCHRICAYDNKGAEKLTNLKRCCDFS